LYCRSIAICSSLLKGDLPLNLPPTAWGTLLSPLLFHPTYKILIGCTVARSRSAPRSLRGISPLIFPLLRGERLFPHTSFIQPIEYRLDAPTTPRLGHPRRSSLAQTYTPSCKLRFGQRAHLLALSAVRCSFFIAPASCTSCFGQRAHLLALSAIRCSFFIAPAPLHSSPASLK